MATDYMDEELDQEDRVRGASNDAPDAPADDKVEGDVATLPRSFCPDMRPGDVFKVRVEKVFSDELLVSYVRGKDGGHAAPEDNDMDPLMD